MRHFYWPSLKFSSDNCGCFPPPAPAPYYWGDSIKSLRRWDCHCPWVAWSGARGQFKQCTELYFKHALFQLRIYKGILPEHATIVSSNFPVLGPAPQWPWWLGCKMLWRWSQQLVSPHQHSTAPHTHPGPDHHHFVITFLWLLSWAEHLASLARITRCHPSPSAPRAHTQPADTLSSPPGYRVQSWHQC